MKVSDLDFLFASNPKAHEKTHGLGQHLIRRERDPANKGGNRRC